LLANKADTRVTDTGGMTPVGLAASQGHLDVAEMLLTSDPGANPNAGRRKMERLLRGHRRSESRSKSAFFNLLREIGEDEDTRKALIAGAFAGLVAGLAAHRFAGGNLTPAIWIAGYVLVIANVERKFVATIVFVVVASFIAVVLRWIGP